MLLNSVMRALAIMIGKSDHKSVGDNTTASMWRTSLTTSPTSMSIPAFEEAIRMCGAVGSRHTYMVKEAGWIRCYERNKRT